MKRLFTLVFVLCALSALAQDPTRFAEEVKKFEQTADDYPQKDRIVFTGSSSIRLWTNFKRYFPNHNVINTGFGGSETTDLIFYKEELISQFQPKQVFIYEGDNDLNSGKSVLQVINDITTLVLELQEEGIEHIVLISPKPSISRWHLKEEYEQLNAALALLSSIQQGLQFADVWTPMLTPEGMLRKELFIEDGLHMNEKGYDIWIKVLKPLLMN